MTPSDKIFFRTTLEYPCNGDREETCWQVMCGIESLIATFEMHTMEIEWSPVHDLLAFDFSDGADTLSPLFEGVQYPAGYEGTRFTDGYEDEMACVVSVIEVGDGTKEAPQYFAVEYDCVIDETPGDYYDEYPPNFWYTRWHVTCCMESDEERVRLYVCVSTYGVWVEDEAYAEVPYFFLDTLFESFLAASDEHLPVISDTPVFAKAVSLDRIHMEPSALRKVSEMTNLPSISDESNRAYIGSVPVSLTELMIQKITQDETADSTLSRDALIGAYSTSRWFMFEDMLRDTYRTIPIVLVLSDKEGHFDIDPQRLCNRLAGMADVFYADMSQEDVRLRLNKIFRRRGPENEFKGRPGRVRIYPGGIDINNPKDAILCPSYRMADIEDAGEPFDQYRALVAETILLQPNPDPIFMDVKSLTRARARESYIRYKETLSNLDSVDHLEAVSIKAMADAGDDAALMLDEAFAMVDSLEVSNRDLKKDSEKQRVELAQITAARDSLFERYNDLVAGQKRHRSLIGQLLDEQVAYKAIEKKLPSSVIEVLDIMANAFPDKLVVLNEAKNSAKNAPVSYLDNAWVILRSVATVLWYCYFGERKDVAIEFYEKTGFELAPMESSETMKDPECKNQRKRTYEGETIFVWSHIKGKNGFRVHYYVDDVRNKIVIGHCGEHLKTVRYR